MTLVSALAPAELRRRLAGAGIGLRTGGYLTRVRSDIGHVAEGIGLLYADYALDDGAFADFYVNMMHSRGLRRFAGRQVRFDHDGHAPFKPLPVAQAYPMFEWSMNWCVSSRVHDCLVIHAAVVERGGLAAILPAPPGSGKSTLCAALVSRGWRLLSDELTMVRLSDGRIAPLPRPISLKNASIDVIRAYAPDMVFSRPVADTSKGTVAHVRAPADSVARAHETARAAWIVFPRYVAGSPPVLEPIVQARAFMQVADNAFNYSLLAGEGFDALGRLVEGTRSFDFRYGALDDAMAVFANLERPPA